MKGQLILALAVAALVSGCASARHISTVSVVAAHSTLKAIDDTERVAVCGTPTAPMEPLCVSAEKHKGISKVLARAFELDAQAARTVRAWPVGSPQPAELGQLVGEITALANQVLNMLPDSPWKAKLLTLIGGK